VDGRGRSCAAISVSRKVMKPVSGLDEQQSSWKPGRRDSRGDGATVVVLGWCAYMASLTHVLFLPARARPKLQLSFPLPPLQSHPDEFRPALAVAVVRPRRRASRSPGVARTVPSPAGALRATVRVVSSHPARAERKPRTLGARVRNARDGTPCENGRKHAVGEGRCDPEKDGVMSSREGPSCNMPSGEPGS